MRAYRIMAVIFVVCVSLLMMEGMARVYYFYRFTANNLMLSPDDTIIYEHKPSIAFRNSHGINVTYNSLGFIGNEIAPKKSGELRILGIGDSITDATYLPEDERYINELASILSAKTGRYCQAVNGAVGGYNSWQEAEFIKVKSPLVDPDLIVVGVCLNDHIADKPQLKKTAFNRVSQNFRDGSKARYLDPLYQTSDLYRLLYDLLSRIRRNKLSEKAYNEYIDGYVFAINESDINQWKVPFFDMISCARSRNAKILFVIFPVGSQVGNKEYSCKPLSDFFKENGVYYLDLITFYNRYPNGTKDLFMKRDFMHPNAKGHAVAAEAIAGYIMDNNILEKI